MIDRRNYKTQGALLPAAQRWLLGGIAMSAVALSLGDVSSANALTFTQGDLVIDTVTGSALDTASPMTLQEFSLGAGGTSATSAGSLTLPQTQSGANAPVSGEYGSASEGFLTQSVNGQYLTIMGYGVNATTFNTAALTTYGTAALGQTTSLLASQQTGTIYTTVPRVVALIGANGSVDTSTALTGVFNTNNPRSAVTVDGSSFYVSGQGVKGDTTEGVFYATRGATTATAIDTSTDTRALAISSVLTGSPTLYVSRDYDPSGSGNQNFTNISTYGGLPTSATPPTRVIPTNAASTSGPPPITGAINLTAGLGNGVNNIAHPTSDPSQTNRVGKFVYLSPEQFFFANSTTLYVADSGQPKNGSVDAAAEGEGGLQKWSLNTSTGVWSLDYDLVTGLKLVNNDSANANTPTAPGVTGLFGLTGKVVGGQVELFATSYGLNELSPSFLYEITDNLSDTTISQASGETFNTLYSAPSDVSIRGVAFAPTPLPSTWTLLIAGFAGLGFLAYRGSKGNGAAVASALL
jgi:hypothetical protein